MKGEIFSNDGICLMYEDTHSLTYHIRVSSLTERLSPHNRHFDLSNYLEDHPLYDISNKGVLGKIKDEAKGGIMTRVLRIEGEAVFVRCSRYSRMEKGQRCEKKCRAQDAARFQDYVNCLKSGRQLYRNMNGIRSFDHQLYSINQRKIALSAFDDKRRVMEDGIHKLAWSIPHDEDLIYLLNFAEHGDEEGEDLMEG